MRNPTLISAISTVLVIVFATPDTLLALSPEGARKSLHKQYKKVKTLEADFREVFEWAMTGETIQRQGRLLVTEDDRFRIDTPEQLLISDGKSIFRYNRIRNTVIIESLPESDQNMLPRRLMLEFADEFKATTLSELPIEGEPGFRLDLIPDNPDQVLLDNAILWVTEKDLIVRRLKFVDLNDNATTYFFTNIQLDQPADTTLTTFTPPEGVELFDLR